MARTGRPRTFDEDEVIDAATDVFWGNGYAGTTMAHVGDRARVLPGSLHAAFGDKHALFLRALERYSLGQRDFGRSLNEPGPVLPRLRDMLYGIGETEHPRGCMLGNTITELAATDPAAKQVVSDAFTELADAIDHALTQAQTTGEVGPEVNCRAHAIALVAMMQGLHVLARSGADAKSLRQAVDTTLAPLAARHRRRR